MSKVCGMEFASSWVYGMTDEEINRDAHELDYKLSDILFRIANNEQGVEVKYYPYRRADVEEVFAHFDSESTYLLQCLLAKAANGIVDNHTAFAVNDHGRTTYFSFHDGHCHWGKKIEEGLF